MSYTLEPGEEVMKGEATEAVEVAVWDTITLNIHF